MIFFIFITDKRAKGYPYIGNALDSHFVLSLNLDILDLFSECSVTSYSFFGFTAL